MVLHPIHLADPYSRIIVRCDDTDAEVLLVYYASKGMFISSVHGCRPRERDMSPTTPYQRNWEKTCPTVYQCVMHSLAVTQQAVCKEQERLQHSPNSRPISASSKNWPILDSLHAWKSLCQQQDIMCFCFTEKKLKYNGRMCTNLDELRYIIASTTDAASAIYRQQRVHLNNMYKEQCIRQQYGATVTSLDLCYGVLSARVGLSEMEPLNQYYLRNPQHLQR